MLGIFTHSVNPEGFFPLCRKELGLDLPLTYGARLKDEPDLWCCSGQKQAEFHPESSMCSLK